MNCEVVTIDQMVNGDLIALAGWPSNLSDTFIGRVNHGGEFVVMDEDNALQVRYADAVHVWFRLTESATLCRHCSEPIEYDDGWYHIDGGLVSCRNTTYATPADDDTGPRYVGDGSE